jgi:phage host-nuclease inhibitor protein Gam
MAGRQKIAIRLNLPDFLSSKFNHQRKIHMNKNTRIKVALASITTRDDAEAAMNELAMICNNERKEIAWRDAEVLEVNRRHEGNLSAYATAKQAKTEVLRAWLETHPEELPKGRKSLDMVSGVIGFRTGTPKLSLVSRAFTWEKVLGLVRRFGILGPTWIRTKEEVNKEVLLGDYANRSVNDAELKGLGLKVVQEESFFIEPKLTNTDPRQTTPAA